MFIRDNDNGNGKVSLGSLEAIIFDLDGTLFDRNDWTVPALRHAAAEMGLDGEKVWELAYKYVERQGHADAGIYNFVLVGSGQSDSALNIRALNSLANQYVPGPGSMRMYPGVDRALAVLRKHFKLGIIVDGSPGAQKAKIHALGLQDQVQAVAYSDEIDGIKSRRPDPRPFWKMLDMLEVHSGGALFVGDDPFRDFKQIRELGLFTARVLTGEYGQVDYPTAEHAADLELTSAARLPEYLDIPHRAMNVIYPDITPKSLRLTGIRI